MRSLLSFFRFPGKSRRLAADARFREVTDAAVRSGRRRPRALVTAGAVLLALTLGACKCPPGTAPNAANVEAIVAENDAARAASAEPESVKAAKALRNREALELARKLAEACR